MVFALIGNQNCGKTTLFNQLTGSNQHVGNFPGVTVEKKEGTIKKYKNVTVVDLPGIYSLSPYTSEEVVTRDFLLKEKPDCIINIVDATNIERNLYLTLQLMEMGVPMVLALNMMDEVRSNGNSIDVNALSAELDMPVLPISASKNEGVDELIDRMIETAEKKLIPQRHDFCKGEVHKAIHSISYIIEDKAKKNGVPTRFAATKLVEGDEPMFSQLSLTMNEEDIIDHVVDDMEKALSTDREAALADMRYEYIEALCRKTVKKSGAATKEQLRSIKIDSVLTHRFFAIPIFLGIMLFVFWITFGVAGAALSKLFSAGINTLTEIVDVALTKAQVARALHSLIIDGIFAGVGSVLSFLPTIIVLFFLLSVLEDSGYMARVAFVMDKALRKIGLSGRSFVPMLIGFGCSVPAIMASRTLSSERDRKMTILLIPFISCSAKLPIYAMLTDAFFKENKALVLLCLYVGGMIMGILSGLLMKSTIFRGNPIPFVMELPSYRFPSFKSVMLHMYEKAKDFVKKAFTIIFFATIIIWFLQSFNYKFLMVTDSADSMLASIGKFFSPIFAPLGFGDWKAATALLTGFSAKEAVVSTLTVLMESDKSVLSNIFTPLTAASFLTFTLLYTPCVAAMAAVKRELGGYRKVFAVMLYQTGVAWVIAYFVFNLGKLFV